MKADLVQDVKQRLSIDDVVGEYVELKRAGRNFKGLSPFNPEKSPSFIVSPEKQIWHDFSSGKGGDSISFVMEVEGLEFRAALEVLARKAGLDISLYQTGGQGSTAKRKEQLKQVMLQSAKFYQVQLLGHKPALEYAIKKRGFNQSTIKDFLVGYSPSSNDSLVKYLKTKGYDQKDIQEAGMGTQRRYGFNDMFRGRLMIPLMDTQGQVIGFTARQVVDDPNGPKYINTPQTLLYDKSRHVFGFSQAKESIRREGFVVVVEGNLDVLSSHQAGIKNVVATAGTAMTAMHLKELKRLTTDIRLSFDADKAGLKATERAIELAQGLDIQLSIISVPDGQDPDDLVRENSEAWREVISKPSYALDWVYQHNIAKYDLGSATGKRQFTDKLVEVLRPLSDAVEQDHYLKKLASDTDISLSAIQSKLANNITKKVKKTYKKPKVQQITPLTDRVKLENRFLGLLARYPTARQASKTMPQEVSFTSHDRQAVYDFVQNNLHSSLDEAEMPEDLRKYEDYVKLIAFTAEQQYQDFDNNDRLREAHDIATKLIKYSKTAQKNTLIEALKAAEEKGDQDAIQDILTQISLIKN